MVTTPTLRIWWSSYRCGTGDDKKVTILGRYAGECAEPAYDGFIGFGQALEVTGYEDVKSLWIPRNCPTGIAGKTCQSDGTNCSLHNYRIAIDIDPFAYGNPHFFKKYGNGWNFDDCKITRDQVEAVEGIKNQQGEQYFRWLGWLIGDTMHFELQVPPERAEVDWNTVPGLPPENGNGGEVGMLPLVAGNQTPLEDVRLLQDRLNMAYGDNLTLDGLYGPSTIESCKTNIGKYTGNNAGKEGTWVGGKQWSRMSVDLIKAHSTGDKGEKGDTGEQGPPGEQGPKGKDGDSKPVTLTIKADTELP